VFDDVKDLDLDGFSGDAAPGQPMVWMNAVSGAFVHGSKASGPADRFLRLTGGAEAAQSGNSFLKP